VHTTVELYAIAYQIEADASERYTLLAGQMQAHNNWDLAGVFSDLARAEGLHAQQIAARSGVRDIAAQGRRLGLWLEGESPESIDPAESHYLMKPQRAIELALEGEERAVAFYQGVYDQASDPDLRALAAEFLADEREHVALCLRLRARYPEPGPGASLDDPDEPQAQD
jgi:rubrerythrin